MNSQSPNEGSSSQKPFLHVGDVPEQISGDVGSLDDLEFDVGQFLLDDQTTQCGTNIVSPQEEIQTQTLIPENILQEDFRQDSVNLFEFGTNNNSLPVENNIWPRQILPEHTSVGNLGSSNISAGNIHPQQNLATPSETSPDIRSQEQYIWPGQMLSGGTSTGNLGNSTIIPESMANPSVPNISFPVGTSTGNLGNSTIIPESMANPSVPNISFPVQNKFSGRILPNQTSSRRNVRTSNINPGNIHPQQNSATPFGTSPDISSQERYIWPGQMLSGGTSTGNLGNSTIIPESMVNPFESVPNISFPVQNNFSGQILPNQASSRRTVRTSNINPAGNIHPQQNLATPFESSPNISSLVPSMFPGQILPSEASRGNVGTSTINPESMVNPFESVPNISFPVQNNFSRQILPNQASSRRNVRTSNINPGGNIHSQQNLATPFETSPNISSSVPSILPGQILPAKASRGNVGTSIIIPESMANPFESVPSIRFPVQNSFSGPILPNQTSSRRTVRTSNINPGNIHRQQNLANRFESSPNVSSSVQSIFPGQILPSEASRRNVRTSIINPGSIHPQQDLTDHPVRYQQNAFQAGQSSNTLEGSAPTAVPITGGQSRNKRSLPSTVINPRRALETLKVPMPPTLTWTRRKKAAKGNKQIVLGRNGRDGPGLSRFSQSKKNPGEISGTSGKEKGIADQQQMSSEDHNFHADPNLSGTINQQQKSSQDDQTNHNLQRVVQEACDREYQRLLKEFSDAAAPHGNPTNTSSQTEGTNLSGHRVNSSDAAIEMPLPSLSLDDLDDLEDQTNSNAPVPQEMDDEFWNFSPEDMPSMLLQSLGGSVEDQSNDAPRVEDQTDNAAASSVEDQPNYDAGF